MFACLFPYLCLLFVLVKRKVDLIPLRGLLMEQALQCTNRKSLKPPPLSRYLGFRTHPPRPPPHTPIPACSPLPSLCSPPVARVPETNPSPKTQSCPLNKEASAKKGAFFIQYAKSHTYAKFYGSNFYIPWILFRKLHVLADL